MMSVLSSKWRSKGKRPCSCLLPLIMLCSFSHRAFSQTVGVETPIVPPTITIPIAKPKDEVSGEVTTLDAFKVDGAPVQNSVTSVRRNANVSVDILTSADYSRFAPTDIADVVIRMPGLSTTTRGSFVVVRGLAERYNPILMDGIVLPSSDPERQTPELDLFPVRLIDAVVVNKVFEAHLPATSSGGAVDLRTKPLPEGRFAQVQIGLKADEGAIKNGDYFRSGSPGNWNLLAQGANDRPAPATTQPEWIARSMSQSTIWSGKPATFPIGTKVAWIFEDRIDLSPEGRAFGYSLSVAYDSSARSEDGRTLGFAGDIRNGNTTLALPDGSLVASVEGEDFSEYEQEVRFGGLLNLGYAFNPNHTLSFTFFLSQVGIENVTRTYNGFSGLNVATLDQLNRLYASFESGKNDPAFRGIQGNDGNILLSESVYYRQRNLTNLKLSGEHKFDLQRSSKVGWSLANIRASQEDPDFSYLGYTRYFDPIPGIPPFYILYGQPVRLPTRYWREVKEKTLAGRLDGELKFDLGALSGVLARAGVYVDNTERTFFQSSFYLTGGPSSEGTSLDNLLTVFRNANYGIGGRSFGTNPAFNNADRKISAAYLSATIPLVSERIWARKFDLALGARLENYKYNAAGRGQLGNAGSADYYIQQSVGQKIGASIVGPASENLFDRIYTRDVDDNTAHPSVALTWTPVDRFNVRLAYSRTVARPSFREMGPYFTNDEVTNEAQHGNVFLNTSKVENADFRVEYFFPKSRDLVALSIFSKTIDDPIEKSADTVIGSNLTVLGWFNNPSKARLKGAELEAAKNFAFWGEAASWFTLGGNATYIDAEVGVFSGESALPGTTRNLFDQPDWIANAYLTFDRKELGFSTTLSAFGISDVLRSTSAGRWNTFVASYNRIDLTMSQRFGSRWSVRLSAKNLTDPDRKFIADPEVTTEEVVLRRFKDGRDYSLSAAYDF